MSETTQNTPPREAKRKRQLLGLGGLVVLLAAGAGGYWYFHASYFVSPIMRMPPLKSLR